ncbi:MAG: hypothetical protein ACM3SU_16675 [Acidobacteriota bacterium]
MPGPDAPIAVVTAMREEFEAIVGRARDARPDGEGFARARIGRTRVVIAITGDGALNAVRAASALCDAYRPSALIGAGIAGALSPGLRTRSLVASRSVRDLSGEVPSPDGGLLGRALSGGDALSGTLVTVGRPVVGSAEKAVLAAAAGEGPAAVDMDSAGWARAAAAHGIPYVIVRAISDEAQESLPDFLAECVGADGSIRRLSVAVRALQRPDSWATLLRMRRRTIECSRTLSRFLESLLRDGA